MQEFLFVLRKINTALLFIIPRNGEFRSLWEKIVIHELSHLTNGAASSKVTIADGGFRHFLFFFSFKPFVNNTKTEGKAKKVFPIFNPRESIWQRGTSQGISSTNACKTFLPDLNGEGSCLIYRLFYSTSRPVIRRESFFGLSAFFGEILR